MLAGADPGFGQVGGAIFRVFNAETGILPHSKDSFPLISDIYIKTKKVQFLLIEKSYCGAKRGWKIFEF